MFRWLQRVALHGWETFLADYETQIMTEFDYTLEAASMRRVRDNIAQSTFRNRVSIPKPLDSLCTPHVLVMELLRGRKLTGAIATDLTRAIEGN